MFQNETVAYYSNYDEDQLLPVMKRMAFLVKKAGTEKKYMATWTKYGESRLMKISHLPEIRGKVVEEYAEVKGTV